MITIREIEQKDNPAIEQIIKQSLESFELNIPGTAYFDPQLSDLTSFYQRQPFARYWVVVDDQDTVLGGAGIGPFGSNPEICELQKLYIAPAAQGRGLAKELMNTVLEYARQHYKYCYLDTFDKLETANSLYLKFGFRRLEKALDETEHNACDAWYIKDLV